MCVFVLRPSCLGAKISDEVSRLGLGPETCLETDFFGVSVSVSKVSGLVSVSVSKDFGLGLELFVSRLCTGYLFMKFCKKEFLKKTVLNMIVQNLAV